MVKLSGSWAEIREADTNLKCITSHMLVKTVKEQRKYDIVGYDSYGDPVRKLSKDPKLINTHVKVSQSRVVGGRVVGMVSFRELYYNPWGIYFASTQSNTFVEMPKILHSILRDRQRMEQLFPSYLPVETVS